MMFFEGTHGTCLKCNFKIVEILQIDIDLYWLYLIAEFDNRGPFINMD